jgi:hypothetical protein
LTNTTQTRQHSIARWVAVAGSLVLSGLVATMAFGQEGSSPQAMHHGPMGQQAKTQQTSAPCSGMMGTNQNMMSSLDHMNSKLDDLVAKMDEARGDAKVAAMSNVLHELVDQRACMVGMLSHMPMENAQDMGHMQGTQGQGMHGSMGMGQTSGSGHMMGSNAGHMGSTSDTSESSSQP